MLHHQAMPDDYESAGYIVYQDIIDPDLIASVRDATKVQGNPLDRWKWQQAPGIVNLAYHPKVLNILRELYEAEPFPFQTLNFNVSPAINIHADTIHFNTIPYGWMCGVWVALEDCTMDNGPLQYYRGSHTLPVVTFEELGLEPSTDNEQLHKNLGNYSQWLENRNASLGLTPDTLLCKAGTVLVWHANLMHKSMQPKPGTTRASQVTHYYFHVPGIRYTVPAFGVEHEKSDALVLEHQVNRRCVI